jgi:hypothetical protein
MAFVAVVQVPVPSPSGKQGENVEVGDARFQLADFRKSCYETGMQKILSKQTKLLTTLLALAYLVLGALGLMLAIPPGYASPISPQPAWP